MQSGAVWLRCPARSGRTTSISRTIVTPATPSSSTERCSLPLVCTRPFGELLTGTGERHASGKVCRDLTGDVVLAAMCRSLSKGVLCTPLVRPSMSTLGLLRLSSRPEGGALRAREPPETPLKAAAVTADVQLAILRGFITNPIQLSPLSQQKGYGWLPRNSCIRESRGKGILSLT